MFTNACEGVKKIHKAEILALIGAVLLLIGSIISLYGLWAGENTSSGEGLLVSGGLIVIIAALLMIIASIMNIIGVSRASKDEPAFKNALIALLFGIAANILVSAFSGNPTISSIGKSVVNVTEILASYYICTGIINLADRLGSSDVSARGQKVRSILMGIWVAAAVLNILSTVFGTNAAMQNVIGIIAIVSGIISIIAYFLYIGLLGRAKQMLAR
ncbi:MAG: hypothetical protein IKH81_01410 [Clostridia bacterium]|nr:hypothetical protein [Clostridia bacterium]MBR2663051.1 hypothetical protein [Clostridia bacterium]MBR6965729.1 hypothetical protein [Clostridia bacterium]